MCVCICVCVCIRWHVMVRESRLTIAGRKRGIVIFFHRFVSTRISVLTTGSQLISENYLALLLLSCQIFCPFVLFILNYAALYLRFSISEYLCFLFPFLFFSFFFLQTFVLRTWNKKRGKEKGKNRRGRDSPKLYTTIETTARGEEREIDDKNNER